MDIKEMHKFATSVARRVWNDDNAESAAGTAVMQIMQKDIPESQIPALLTTITRRRVIDAIRSELGRKPAPPVGISDPDEIRKMMSESPVKWERPASLDTSFGHSGELVPTQATVDSHEHDIAEHDAARHLFETLSERLTERQTEILTMMYRGMTQVEIGEHFGVTNTRICQIRGQIKKIAREVGIDSI